jgi:hypothetical protein
LDSAASVTAVVEVNLTTGFASVCLVVEGGVGEVRAGVALLLRERVEERRDVVVAQRATGELDRADAGGEDRLLRAGRRSGRSRRRPRPRSGSRSPW